MDSVGPELKKRANVLYRYVRYNREILFKICVCGLVVVDKSMKCVTHTVRYSVDCVSYQLHLVLIFLSLLSLFFGQ